ncbi:MAG: FHA domain-containing protein [Planctomycetota bacterium]
MPPTRVGQAAPPFPPPQAPPMMPPPRRAPKGGGKTRVMAVEQAAEKKIPVVGWLVALNGNHKGDDFRIREGKNTIGSDPSSDMCITDGHVSTRHANINYVVRNDERVFVLVDLDSTNGTFLNDSDEPVYHEELVDNDTIMFGTTKCKFKCL